MPSNQLHYDTVPYVYTIRYKTTKTTQSDTVQNTVVQYSRMPHNEAVYNSQSLKGQQKYIRVIWSVRHYKFELVLIDFLSGLSYDCNN